MEPLTELPQAIAQSEMQIGGIAMRVYNLDDGRRIIDADDVHAFFQALEAGLTPDADEMIAFAQVLRGAA